MTGLSKARYVLGFCFDFGYHNVLLIEKQRPTWQMGKLNGIGGKIEEGETPAAAMTREFWEETEGLVGDPAFTPYGRLTGLDFEVWLFHTKVSSFPLSLNGREIGGEILCVVDREDASTWMIVPNVRILLPMAFNHARKLDGARFVEIVLLESPPSDLTKES